MGGVRKTLPWNDPQADNVIPKGQAGCFCSFRSAERAGLRM